MNINDRIKNFTSVAPIPGSWSFGPRGGYGYEVVRVRVETNTVYRDKESGYTPSRSSSNDYVGFGAGLVIGSMF